MFLTVRIPYHLILTKLDSHKRAKNVCTYFKSEMVIYIIYQGVTTSQRICYLRRKCRNLNF
jgi:hypothetical protein